MEKSLFEKIADREIPAYIVHETDEFMAFLDIFPSTYAQTLVIPKKQHDSYLFRNNDAFIQEFIIYVKEVATLLDQKLGSERCILMFEGLEVPHLHAKLYPYFPGQKSGNINAHNVEKLTETQATEILKKLQ